MPIRFELPPEHPHVAVVTIDRPAQSNALDPRRCATFEGLRSMATAVLAGFDLMLAAEIRYAVPEATVPPDVSRRTSDPVRERVNEALTRPAGRG